MLGRILDIVAIQAAPHPLGTPFAVFADEARAAVAAHPGLDLLVYPELHLFHAPQADRAEANAALRDAAQPMGGDLDHALAALAAELGVTLVPGTLCEAGPMGELFNTARVYGACGTVLASYRKIFPWRPSEPYDPGSGWVVFDLPGKGRIGLTICYDAWFPEATRQVAWLGAELVLNLVKTTTHDRAQELILARAAAITNQIFLLSVNCAGPIGMGDSLLVGPEGEVLAQSSGSAPGVIRAAIDLERVAQVRDHGTCGENRMWSQFRPGEARIALPAYGGHIDPANWNPTHRTPDEKAKP
jgi:predicted amidohydrolase